MLSLDQATFESTIGSNRIPVIVDFWAPWCGPCRAFAPVFEEVSHRFEGRVLFARVNTDENPAIGPMLHIRSIPTLVLFHQGREGRRISGALPAAEFHSWLKSLLG